MENDQAAPRKEEVPDAELSAGQGDLLLAGLVRLVNAQPMELDVTLTVGGLVIVGRLVSAQRYFTWLGESFAGGLPAQVFDEAARERIKQSFVGFSEGQEEGAPLYLHVSQAQMFFPGQRPMPLEKDLWWRGRLESVDGFSLQRLSASVS